ncbi:hypothetical protein [Spirillospora sp. NBC_01491]|uniref:hypothetical protein n=1 Tax=Spirillospora sp. NBC_01491 TaxID=2976007 RepID=UPI002E2FC378|nr:hypothetical protein [Spirillospora sp. NBC_01491]
MGLRERLVRFGTARPRPFVVASAGGTRARLMAEAEVRRRGWREAGSPAETGLLVVCGDPGAALAEAIETVWRDAPGPRARVRLPAEGSAAEVSRVLDAAVAELADVAAQHADAQARITAGPWNPAAPDDGGDTSAMDHDMDHGTGHDREHGGHEHHMMMRPGGLAMAEQEDDRDGLRLDVLHVPFGPVLRAWPAGLRIDTALQGDVVQLAEVTAVDTTGDAPYWDGAGVRRRVAGRLDSAGRLLYVAGWDGAASRAALLRDGVLDGASGDVLGPRFAVFARRVGRSRTLRWMTGGIGRIAPEAAERHGLAARHGGDVAVRLDGWLSEIAAGLPRLDEPASDRLELGGESGAAGPLAVLPGLLEGEGLAAARLIVASLDPDLAGLGRADG